jgi:hypothetical protein
MRLRPALHIIPLFLSAVILVVAGRAGDPPAARHQIAIVSTTDVWSELSACG